MTKICFAESTSDGRLMNPEYIESYLTHEASWHEGHGAEGDFLGFGLVYYALAYMQKAKPCVCLGSGSWG